jgi:phosphoglycolate phosphatase-like HAD superfamily hydrolase
VLKASSHFAEEMSKRMASFPLMVFDLDGTLVDALPDLTAALNRMLASRSLRPLTPADVRPMIGDGTKKLVERALAAGSGLEIRHLHQQIDRRDQGAAQGARYRALVRSAGLRR